MSFEDYLKHNREGLYDKEAGPELWDRIDKAVESKSVDSSSKNLRLVMALIFVLIAGVFVSYIFYSIKQQSNALEETKQELFAIRSIMEDQLQNKSSFKRIKAVNMSANYVQSDPEITNALINTMLNDEDEAVRMASINALEMFAELSPVKEALIQVLEVSDRPFIQVKIINILADINDKRILPLLDQIIDDQGRPGYVKEEALIARNSIKSL